MWFEIVLERLSKWTMSKYVNLSPKSLKSKNSFERVLYDLKLENLPASNGTVEAMRGRDAVSTLNEAAASTSAAAFASTAASTVIPDIQYTHNAAASSPSNVVNNKESKATLQEIKAYKARMKEYQAQMNQPFTTHIEDTTGLGEFCDTSKC